MSPSRTPRTLQPTETPTNMPTARSPIRTTRSMQRSAPEPHEQPDELAEAYEDAVQTVSTEGALESLRFSEQHRASAEARAARLERMVETLAFKLEQLTELGPHSTDNKPDDDNERSIKRRNSGIASDAGASTMARSTHLDQIARGLMNSIPKYDGKGGPARLQSFVTKFEAFLDYAADIPPTAAVTIAASKLVDAADIWWNKHLRQFPREDPGRIRCWQDFRKRISAKFLPPEFEDEVRNQLFGLRQPDFDSVTEYIDAYNVLHMQLLSGGDDRLYIQRFVQGLKRHVRDAIIVHRDNLSTLDACQEAARRHEQLSRSLDSSKPTAHHTGHRDALHGQFGHNNNNRGQRRTPSTIQKSTTTTFKNRHGKVIDQTTITCHGCHKKGHFRSACPNAQANEANESDNALAAHTALITSRELAPLNPESHSMANGMDLIIDCGATRHMVPDRRAFSQFTAASGTVGTAGSQELRIHGKGTAVLNLSSGKIILHNCLYVPNLRRPLFSLSAARARGLEFTFLESGDVHILKSNVIVAHAVESGGLYKFSAIANGHSAVAAAASAHPPSSLWHQRLTHLGNGSLRRAQNASIGLPRGNLSLTNVCEPCALSKQTRTPFPRSVSNYNLGVLVHADITGPFPRSLNGNTYALHYTEHHSRLVRAYFLNTKRAHAVLACYQDFESYVGTQCGTAIQIHRSDNGGEFTSEEFNNYLSEKGVQRQLSVRDTPAQNGVAERTNRTFLERTRAVLTSTGLPDILWEEIWNACVHVYNRIPHSTTMAVPLMAFTRSLQPPNLGYLRILGSVTYSHVLKHQRSSKISSAAERLILVGYSDCAKAYKLWNPITDSITIRRDITVDEDTNYSSSGFNIQTKVSRFGLSEHTENRHGFTIQTSTDPLDENVPDEDVLVFLTTSGDPATFREAVKSHERDAWISAMRTELDSMARNNVWTLVQRPKDIPTITGKWVYRTKRTPTGNIDKYKARYVARGFVQTHGVNFFETFSPVVSLQTLRLFLALAITQNWIMRQGDVVTAYLQSDLDVPIFMEQPLGFSDDKHPRNQYVCRLNKALYGLRQSGRLWNATILEFAATRNFTPLTLEPCVLFRRCRAGGAGDGLESTTPPNLDSIDIIMLIYVDDLVFLGPSMERIAEEECAFASRFTMSPFQPLHHLLGIRIEKSVEGILLTQEAYARKVLDRFDFSNSRAQPTPMDTNNELVPFEGKCDDADRHKFQEIVGSLMYLSIATRPDLATSVNILGRYASNPGPEHFAAAKRILRYLNGTVNLGLQYPAKMEIRVTTYSDADWAGDRSTRKSTSGLVIFIGKAAVHWRSTLQTSVARSSTEAEYLSASNAGQETMGIFNVLQELTEDNTWPVPELRIDNNGARQQIMADDIKRRSKHIEVHEHYIRDLARKNRIKTSRVVLYPP